MPALLVAAECLPSCRFVIFALQITARAVRIPSSLLSFAVSVPSRGILSGANFDGRTNVSHHFVMFQFRVITTEISLSSGC